MTTDKPTDERVEELAAENEQLREQVEELQSAVAEIGVQESTEEMEDDDGGITLSNTTRRRILASMAAAGLVGAGVTGTAAAASDGDPLEFGGAFTGASSNNRALEIVETSGDSSSIGLRVGSDAADGTGIRAFASANSGRSIGLSAVSQSPSGVGVQGQAAASSGSPIGLLGITDNGGGKGLQGTNRSGSGTGIGIEGRSDSSEGVAIRGRATASSGTTYGVWGTTASPDGFGLYTPDDCKIEGDLMVSGTKNFVQAVETPTGQKEVVYTAVESGMPRTETTDVAELSDGRAEIELPDHFEMVTSEDEPLSVQVTPYAEEEANPQVVERSIKRIVVEDFSDDAREYTFAYTVKGVREGFEDQEIVQNS